MDYTYGIDISKWQGQWRDPQATVDAGVQFVIMRALNGTRKDSRVEEYAHIAKFYGLNFGVYQYFRPGQDAKKQARALYDLHVSLGCNMVPQLDIEHGDDLPIDKVTHQVKIYIEEVERLFGRSASIYSAAWWWDKCIIDGQIDMTDRIKWVARYVSMKSGPQNDVDTWRDWALKFDKRVRMPRAWGDWDLWQFSADGNSKGRDLGFSSSHLDLNIAKPGVLEKLIITEATPPVQIDEEPSLSKGSRGQAVKDLQTLLRKAGFAPGPIDGIFGHMTETAVKRFQRSVGAAVTGVVTEDTVKKLEGSTPVKPGLSTVKRSSLRKGSRGPEVVVLQTLLRAKGFYRARVDGDFGPVTDRAVRSFQKAVGIAVDGWVGPVTWSKLV